MLLKKFVPKRIKQPIKKAVLRRQLSRAISRLATLGKDEIPSRDLLLDLIIGWDNEGYVANLDYLEQVARSSIESTGNILECGSGVTTLLMGVLSGRGREVWSLEHSADWRALIAGALEKNGISPDRVCFSPLVDYGKFSWYDPPLTQMPSEFSLVICDGPPGATKGGRYGLLPVMLERLTDQCLILLDDADRPGEVELIKRWEVEFGFKASIVNRSNHCFALLRR